LTLPSSRAYCSHVDFENFERGYLLPHGDKDIQVHKSAGGGPEHGFQAQELAAKVAEFGSELFVLKASAMEGEDGFVITARLPELRSGDIEITVEGRDLRIVVKLPGAQFPIKSVSVTKVPVRYAVAAARASYVKGQLRIVIPKAAA
jgi:HSP20 family molecular chaperone IbpA